MKKEQKITNDFLGIKRQEDINQSSYLRSLVPILLIREIFGLEFWVYNRLDLLFIEINNAEFNPLNTLGCYISIICYNDW